MAWRWPWPRKTSSTLDLFRDILGWPTTKSGQRVSYKTALEVATVFACARVLAEGVSQVPLKLFRESADGKSREPAKDHQLYWLLNRRPNLWQTSFQYRETVMLHAVLCGAHYSFINRVEGRIVELLPLDPATVTPKINERTAERSYEVRGASGAMQTFAQQSIWQVTGPSWNGWRGLEAVTLAREAIGLSMAIEEQQSRFYERGAQSGGAYSIEGKLTDEQYKKLRKWIEDEHAGSKNAFRPMILDNGAKWLSTELNGTDAQTLEQRKYQVEEICRALRVMPIMVGFSDKTATYASAEQMFLAHVVHSLAPWYERIEQQIDVDLIGEEDARAGVYAKFVEEGLLRGASKDTADFLSKLSTAGIMTRNEARAKLDMNPIDGLDEPLTPSNVTIGTDPAPPADPPPPAA